MIHPDPRRKCFFHIGVFFKIFLDRFSTIKLKNNSVSGEILCMLL